jgi:hypothetical protein
MIFKITYKLITIKYNLPNIFFSLWNSLAPNFRFFRIFRFKPPNPKHVHWHPKMISAEIDLFSPNFVENALNDCTPQQLASVIEDAIDWAHCNGLVLRTKEHKDRFTSFL